MLSLNTLRSYEWLPILVLRLSIGFMFFSGAIGELADPTVLAAQFRASGIPFAETTAPFAAVVELLGVLALLLCTDCGRAGLDAPIRR